LYLACKCCLPYKTGVFNSNFFQRLQGVFSVFLQKYIQNWFLWLLLDRWQLDLISWVGRRLCWRNGARRADKNKIHGKHPNRFSVKHILQVILPKWKVIQVRKERFSIRCLVRKRDYCGQTSIQLHKIKDIGATRNVNVNIFCLTNKVLKCFHFSTTIHHLNYTQRGSKFELE